MNYISSYNYIKWKSNYNKRNAVNIKLMMVK